MFSLELKCLCWGKFFLIKYCGCAFLLPLPSNHSLAHLIFVILFSQTKDLSSQHMPQASLLSSRTDDHKAYEAHYLPTHIEGS